MITMETGLPGAGKTLYCVDKLLRPLVGSVCHYKDENDNDQQARRTIYTNVNGLLLEHEKIEAGPEWVYDDKRGTLQGDACWTQPKGTNKLGLNNWHEWAKPGSVIVYDEIQKPWPLTATGSRKPPPITALETHRHMGVDFICMTQHPMLVHSGLSLMVARHLHVRKMGNMPLAIVYEWDSISRTLLYKNSISKSPYRYDKAVYQLYKSSELHTKLPRKIPSLVWGILFGLAAIGWFAPNVYGRLAERINPAKVVAKLDAVPSVAPGVPPGQKPGSTTPGMLVETVQNPLPPPSPEVVGCGQIRSVCRCYDKDGIHVEKPEAFCLARVLPAVPAKTGSGALLDRPMSLVSNSGDDEVLAWMAKRR